MKSPIAGAADDSTGDVADSGDHVADDTHDPTTDGHDARAEAAKDVAHATDRDGRRSRGPVRAPEPAMRHATVGPLPAASS